MRRAEKVSEGAAVEFTDYVELNPQLWGNLPNLNGSQPNRPDHVFEQQKRLPSITGGMHQPEQISSISAGHQLVNNQLVHCVVTNNFEYNTQMWGNDIPAQLHNNNSSRHSYPPGSAPMTPSLNNCPPSLALPPSSYHPNSGLLPSMGGPPPYNQPQLQYEEVDANMQMKEEPRRVSLPLDKLPSVGSITGITKIEPVPYNYTTMLNEVEPIGEQPPEEILESKDMQKWASSTPRPETFSEILPLLGEGNLSFSQDRDGGAAEEEQFEDRSHEAPGNLVREDTIDVNSMNDYPGEHEFQVELAPPNPTKGRKGETGTRGNACFSEKNNTVFCMPGEAMELCVRVRDWTAVRGCRVRAFAVFLDAQWRNREVRRCHNCLQGDLNTEEKYQAQKDHYLQLSNGGAEYGAVGSRKVVSVKLGTPRGADSWPLLLAVMCRNSCVGGANRKSLGLVIQLLGPRGAVWGQRVMNLKCCAAPGRDMRGLENGKAKPKLEPGASQPSGGQKRKLPRYSFKTSSADEGDPVVPRPGTRGLLPLYVPVEIAQRAAELVEAETLRRLRGGAALQAGEGVMELLDRLNSAQVQAARDYL